MHVLLVDDEPKVREVVRRRLERLGFQVTEAGDADEALRLQRESPREVLVTDIVMPGKEGIQAVREFRREWPDMRIVAISGGGLGSADTYLNMALKLGADAVLAKPFTSEDLEKAIGLTD